MTKTSDPSAPPPGPWRATGGVLADPTPHPPAALRGRLVRGRPEDPAWVRPSLLALLAVTGLLYLWNLSASGWANSFYAAAVQAGSHSWTALFFGSSDAANFITVDKPPASLWVMGLSVRLFGLTSWSLLVPQALEGVATVAVLYAAVRRAAGPTAGLLAGAALALTPVAALMFRFDNPDALLVLLMVGAAYAVQRALEHASTRWLLVAGGLVGLGFLTKQLQVLLVVPPLALTYLLAAPTGLGRRLLQLLAAGAAVLVSAGWWIAAVTLVPAGMRPYIGGSQTNSIIELTLRYNGLGRLTGEQVGSVGGRPAGAGGRWGQTGLLRLVGSEIGGQIAWLLPAALLLLLAGLWLTRRASRVDSTRAALVLWGGWLVVTALVFSLMKGIFHAYYTVALAPAVAALVGIGAALAWQRRDRLVARAALVLAAAATAGWAYVLLARTPTWLPWLRPAVLVAGLAAALALAWSPYLRRRAALAASLVAILGGLAAPTAASVQTVLTAHTGAIPTAGPAVAGGRGGLGGRFGPMAGGRPMAPPTGAAGRADGRFGGGLRGGGPGGLLDAATPGSALVRALQADAGQYTWVAATVGSNSAAGPQLASGLPVMAIGGFNGSDPTPTLAAFQAYVAAGKIHYFLAGGRGGPGTGSTGTAGQITSWAQSAYTATTIDGVTLYDLTAPVTGS